MSRRARRHACKPDSRKKVVPELMPRGLYWFRWGAVYTWTTGILMARPRLLFGRQPGEVRTSSPTSPRSLTSLPWPFRSGSWGSCSSCTKPSGSREQERKGRGRHPVRPPRRRALPAFADLHGPRRLHPRRHACRDHHGDERLDADLAGAEEVHSGRHDPHRSAEVMTARGRSRARATARCAAKGARCDG